MRRILILALLLSGVAAALLYVVDFGLARFGPNSLGTVIVTRYYVIPQKNGKTQFVFQPPALQNCVHSLFAHRGYLPCWYLKGHTEQPIKM